MCGFFQYGENIKGGEYFVNQQGEVMCYRSDSSLAFYPNEALAREGLNATAATPDDIIDLRTYVGPFRTYYDPPTTSILLQGQLRPNASFDDITFLNLSTRLDENFPLSPFPAVFQQIVKFIAIDNCFGGLTCVAESFCPPFAPPPPSPPPAPPRPPPSEPPSPPEPPPPPPEPDEFGITVDDLIAYVSAVAATGLLAGIGQFLRRRGFKRTAKIFDKAQVGAEKIGGRKATEPGARKASVSREKQLEDLGKSTLPRTTGRVMKASNEPILLGVTPSNVYKAGGKIGPVL